MLKLKTNSSIHISTTSMFPELYNCIISFKSSYHFILIFNHFLELIILMQPALACWLSVHVDCECWGSCGGPAIRRWSLTAHQSLIDEPCNDLLCGPRELPLTDSFIIKSMLNLSYNILSFSCHFICTHFKLVLVICNHHNSSVLAVILIEVDFREEGFNK